VCRGEIAVRICRAARELGIESVGVYTDGDVGALHPRVCDTAYRVPSYTDPASLVSLATKLDVDCVHPGYGFLSERPEFAAACSDVSVCLKFRSDSIDVESAQRKE
jgi:acetyl/propionyl-CoA carboxylase alpha subunit